MKILSNIGKIVAKGVGITALGVVGYDAHHIGKIQADTYASEKDAAYTEYYLNNTLYSNNMSKTADAIKEKSFKMELDNGWKRFINTGVGYLKGFGSALVSHVLLFGMGLGALLTKGKVSKIFAGGIGIYGLYEFLRNFFGLGTPGGLK